MPRSILIMFILAGIGSGLTACNIESDNANRWYTDEQLRLGKHVFTNHCAACHGDRAQGLVADWKRRQADGFLPPPPLNGTAHAWHHSLPLLIEIIQKGGALYDGKMPGFDNNLSEEEQYAVIAWFQSQWNDEIYQLWSKTESQIQQLGEKP